MAEREVQVPYTMTIAVPEGTEIHGLITLQRRGKVLKAVFQPHQNHPIPGRTPEVLRWLADHMEISLLPEHSGE